MLNSLIPFFIFVLTASSVWAQDKRAIRKDVPLDSIVLSDPFILADQNTQQYYMTGTGGLLWKSDDLKRWEGPYQVAQTDLLPRGWMKIR